MAPSVSRRQVLQAGAGTALLGLTDLAALAGLGPVSAAEATLDPNLVRLQPDIEPLVRFIETTPRDQLIEDIASRLLERSVKRIPDLAAISGPIAAKFKASGMTEDQLSELLEAEKHAMRAQKRAKAS